MQQVFNQKDRELIASMPLSVFKRQDRFFWCFLKSGTYTVKTSYAKAIQASSKDKRKQKLEEETRWEIRKHSIWKQLWNLNLKHKLKHFIWKCLEDGIAIKEALHKRTGERDNICTICGEEEETVEHMFFKCPSVDLDLCLLMFTKQMDSTNISSKIFSAMKQIRFKD